MNETKRGDKVSVRLVTDTVPGTVVAGGDFVSQVRLGAGNLKGSTISVSNDRLTLRK